MDAGSGAVAGAKAIVPEPLGCCLRCVLGGNVEVPSPLRWAQVRYGIYNIFIYIYVYINIFTKHPIYGIFAYIWLIFYGKCTAKYTIRGGGFKCFFKCSSRNIGEIIQFDEHICSKVLKPPTRFP